jgi:hypothetical protein
MMRASRLPASGSIRRHVVVLLTIASKPPRKLLEGFLVLAGIGFRKMHDLDSLAQSLPPHCPTPESVLTTMSSRTAWGVVYRDPAEDEPVSSAEEVFAALNVIAPLDTATVVRATQAGNAGTS